MKRQEATGGWTLLEVVVVMLVVAILASAIVPSYRLFQRRAEKAACIGKMRALHSAFGAYLLENNRWPQMPEDLDYDESTFFKWWIEVLEPYGVSSVSWLCPADRIQRDYLEKNKDQFTGSYVPTLFNEHPHTPYRWQQPWLMERGDFHGKGAHVAMPDGSIHSWVNPYGER